MVTSALLVTTLLALQSQAGDSHLLIVSGIGGQPQYTEAFHRWGSGLYEAATERLGLPESNIVYLAERVELDPRIQARSTKENLEQALVDIGAKAGPTDRVFIVLIGHGSTNNDEPRFNLPGPDVAAADLAEHFRTTFPTQMVVLANTASASGDFLAVLSGPNRVILTATKTGFERNEAIFGEFFVEAFAGDGADVDKDERVSVLEAFNYARIETARRYESDERLLTEHAMLDDNGDGEGSTEPDPREEGSDGALARTLFLDRVGVMVAGHGAGDSVLVTLYNEKRGLEERIATLRNLKDQMEEAAYEAELEELLVELALKNRAIREREAGR
jgi:hypothetical protein